MKPIKLEEDTIPTKDGAGEPATPKLRKLGETLDEALRRTKARMDGRERPIPTPWPEVNAQLGKGYWPGLHVFVGGTGVGKTQFCVQAGVHAARAGFPVGYIGLELEEMQIALRMLCASEWNETHEKYPLKWSKLYTGDATQNQMERAALAQEELAKLPIYVEEGKPQGWPVSELHAFAQRMRDAHPQNERGALPMLIVLDFLQIVGDEDPQHPTDLRERIGRAAYAAREVSRKMDVAVLMVSSAARNHYGLLAGEIEKAGLWAFKIPDGPRKDLWRRGIKNPDMLVGLGKESGEIEYSADSVTVAVKVGKATEADKGEEHNSDALRISNGKKSKIKGTQVVIATAKGRATGASWCDLTFDGTRFYDGTDGGESAVNAIQEAAEKKRRDEAIAANGGKKSGKKGKQADPTANDEREPIES